MAGRDSGVVDEMCTMLCGSPSGSPALRLVMNIEISMRRGWHARAASRHATWRPLLPLLLYSFPIADAPRLLIRLTGLVHWQPPAGGHRSEPSSVRATCALPCSAGCLPPRVAIGWPAHERHRFRLVRAPTEFGGLPPSALRTLPGSARAAAELGICDSRGVVSHR